METWPVGLKPIQNTWNHFSNAFDDIVEALNIAQEEFGRRGERESSSFWCCFSLFYSTLLFSGSKSIYRAKHCNIKRLQDLHIFKMFFNPIQPVIRSRHCCYYKTHFRSQVCVISGRFVYELERSFVALTCDEGRYFMVFSLWRLIIDLYPVR